MAEHDQPGPRPSAEARYRLLHLLAQEPQLSQREIARRMGVSLGKTNYCLRALLEKGHVKAVNFTNSRRKRAYLYQLTPTGLAAKTRAARAFLGNKRAEYERLEREIAELRAELEGARDEAGAGPVPDTIAEPR